MEKVLIGYDKTLRDNPNRRILMETECMYIAHKGKKGGKKVKSLHCILFSDFLMLTSRNKDTFRFRSVISLVCTCISERSAEGNSSFLFIYLFFPPVFCFLFLSVFLLLSFFPLSFLLSFLSFLRFFLLSFSFLRFFFVPFLVRFL